ncbi:TonB-dependent siderophore receptor [Massilia sp. PAMC28688]|uniref:TonB-dependent siderophore receptor n=1 Tax=Massilia sp. PAMC28688 TaxID=2861283 RepID=UPI001C6248FA|nr:TonB-dependent siderophore receptor [Massilia sp. PAMC28688]QYF92445.1 TonB-dependent siderophore receptor [Massilia sp. PAMC28688]
MSSPSLQHTVIALAVFQAFSSCAQAQTTEQPMTEVVVTGQWIAADRASVGSFSDVPLLKTPASILSIGREQMQDLNIRNTSDASRFEASVSDSYNAVGYAEMFSIRGFKLDNNTSYRKDGFAISNDTQIPLENKERIEILKGLAGMQAGVTGPGGIINYAVKRPTRSDLRSVTVEVRERGTVLGTVDVGGRFDDKRFGYRFNAAAEKLRPYVKGADGERTFASAAFDWQVSDRALVQLDMDYQDKSQITAPGYQLIRNVALPSNVSAATLLNDQPWTRPVETISSNIGLRFEYRISDAWRATVAANRHEFKRDDYTAFPYGCSEEGDGFYPGYCSNGDYDVYDYQSEGERKTPFGSQALVQGTVRSGGIKHELAFGYADMERREYYGDYVYDYAGASNIYRNRIVPPAPGNPRTGDVIEQRHDTERAAFVQDVMTLTPELTVHAGARHVTIKRGPDYKASFTLPNLSVVYSPATDWIVYGTVAHGMEYGGEAPFGTLNYRTAQGVLAPSRSKQLELGMKGVVNDNVTLTGALFELKRGKELTNADNYYVRAGEQTHRGIELAAQGKATRDLYYSVSAMALHTRTSGSGSALFDGKRTANVPAFKGTALLEYSVPAVSGLKLTGVLQYAGKKAFDDENLVFVPSYHVIDLGAAYATRIGGYRTTLRAHVENVADKFYWRDATPELGGYLLPGAPRRARLSAQVDF